jgi:hypothetical protein
VVRKERDRPIPLAQRLLGGNSNCLPRAASKLAHRTKTGSDIDAANPLLRREFQRLRVDLRLRGQAVPGEKEAWGFLDRPSGARARPRTEGRGGWRRPSSFGVTTLGGDGAAALKVEAYRPQPRARSEGRGPVL